MDGVNVMGYLHWSLIDNLEWAMGFNKRFGLIHVDMNAKKRTSRPSAYIYSDIIKNNAIPEYLSEYSGYPSPLAD
ncbi:MAG: family 1 glycosylhydrolase [Thermoproteota archaeon]